MFSQYHKQQERIFIERLFYLVLNNVLLTNFSTFNVNSIINISQELEKYQRMTNKYLFNAEKLNTIIQFVLSFSSSTLTTFHLNNLFYLSLNDINDLPGKIIDRMAELLRIYHSMTYGHPITKQYLLTSVRSFSFPSFCKSFHSQIDHAISTVNYANPIIYPLYENFLNTSFVSKSLFSVHLSKQNTRVSLFTIIQNLAIVLLGLTLDDFDDEDQYLSLTAEQCYHIRLIIRRLTYLFENYQYPLEFPLENLDKQLVISLIKSIVVHQRTYEALKRLLDFYLMSVRGFSSRKIKHLLYELLKNNALEIYTIETIRYFLELNHFYDEETGKCTEEQFWLSEEQIRLITHRFYSKKIYLNVFLPLFNGDCQEEHSIEDILTYLDQMDSKEEQVIDVQEMNRKLTIVS